MVKFYEKDALIRAMFGGKTVSQSAFGRFLVSPFDWRLFNLKRVAKFQEDAQTQLVDGDVIALDDSLIAHNHARKIPFIYRLWDHCTEAYIDAMNLVVLHAKKASGLQYPLFYSIWKQDNDKDPHLTRLSLALAMLTELRGQVADNLKLWVCFDAGYYGIDFYLAVEKLKFLWVTNLCMAFKNIYIAIDEIHNGQGYLNEKVLKPINVVVSLYQKEDPKTGEMKQTIALFHSNQLDAKPEEIMGVYLQRWAIETFFWHAKQELGLNDCHSTDENHIHAHLSLLFVAESLVRFAQWDYNEKEKTGLNEEVTHGQVVELLFHTRCEVNARSKDSIQVYFDTTSQRFANFFRKYWPTYLKMNWFDSRRNWNLCPTSG